MTRLQERGELMKERLRKREIVRVKRKLMKLRIRRVNHKGREEGWEEQEENETRHEEEVN